MEHQSGQFVDRLKEDGVKSGVSDERFNRSKTERDFLATLDESWTGSPDNEINQLPSLDQISLINLNELTSKLCDHLMRLAADGNSEILAELLPEKIDLEHLSQAGSIFL